MTVKELIEILKKLDEDKEISMVKIRNDWMFHGSENNDIQKLHVPKIKIENKDKVILNIG